MDVKISIFGSMNPTFTLELSLDFTDDEYNEICISIPHKEADLYVNFYELKSIIDAIHILKICKFQKRESDYET